MPYYGVVFTASFSALAYLSCSAGPATVFIWLNNIGTLVALFAWVSVCITYLRFYAALKKQGVDRDTLPFKSPFQPYLAWGTTIYFTILLIFNGFYAFAPWNTENFISTYITVP